MMTSRVKAAVVLGTVFAAGLAAGAWASKKGLLGPELFHGKSAKEAGQALLGAAQTMVEKQGSWEHIAVGRVLYLSGDKAGAQAIFDRVLSDKKAKAGDYFRVARVVMEAGDWDKARPLFDKVLELEPKDQDWLAQIGAYYLLKGDRTKAEELFTRSFGEESDSLYNALRTGGAYLGVKPD